MTKFHSERKRLIRLYRESARRIAEGEMEFSCSVVWLFGNPEDVDLYQKTIKLDVPVLWNCTKDEQYEIRILLLLFMAEWVRTDYTK
jgi:hypothetical protein